MDEQEIRIIGGTEFRKINKRTAAVAQLEDAILLWFSGSGNPVSIHTLAVAANDCLHAMGKMRGRPSSLKGFLSRQSKTFQKGATEAQNFFKHGFKDLKKSIDYAPLLGEMIIFDSVVCYEFAIGPATPLMRAFATRFVIESGEVPTLGGPFVYDSFDVEKFAKLDRAEFIRKILPLFEANPTPIMTDHRKGFYSG